MCVCVQSPQYSSGGSYDSVKMDISAEDLTMGRHGSQVAPDDDDDDHDDHDDNDKINDTEGVDPERLKAFNVSRETFSSVPHCHVPAGINKLSPYIHKEEVRSSWLRFKTCRLHWSRARTMAETREKVRDNEESDNLLKGLKMTEIQGLKNRLDC